MQDKGHTELNHHSEWQQDNQTSTHSIIKLNRVDKTMQSCWCGFSQGI